MRNAAWYALTAMKCGRLFQDTPAIIHICFKGRFRLWWRKCMIWFCITSRILCWIAHSQTMLKPLTMFGALWKKRAEGKAREIFRLLFACSGKKERKGFEGSGAQGKRGTAGSINEVISEDKDQLIKKRLTALFDFQNPASAPRGTERNRGAVGFALRKNPPSARIPKIHRFRFHFIR